VFLLIDVDFIVVLSIQLFARLYSPFAAILIEFLVVVILLCGKLILELLHTIDCLLCIFSEDFDLHVEFLLAAVELYLIYLLL